MSWKQPIYQVEMLEEDFKNKPIPKLGSGNLDQESFFYEDTDWAEYFEDIDKEELATFIEEFEETYPMFLTNKKGIYQITNESAAKYFEDRLKALKKTVANISLNDFCGNNEENKIHCLINIDLPKMVENRHAELIYEDGIWYLDHWIRETRGFFVITQIIEYEPNY